MSKKNRNLKKSQTSSKQEVSVAPEDSSEEQEQKSKTNKIFNVPNLLTIFRIVAVPFIMWMLLVYNWYAYWGALILYLIVLFTDFLDGYLARKDNKITNFGKILDPIADKILVFGMFIVILIEIPSKIYDAGSNTYNASYASALSLVYVYILFILGTPMLLIAIREIGITIYRYIFIKKYKKVIPAGWLGKAKTVLQFITITLYILLWFQGSGEKFVQLFLVATIFLYISMLVSLFSGAIYIKRGHEFVKFLKSSD